MEAQVFVPAEAAGVMFTAGPLDGARDTIMISANWGLGESVVAGDATPDVAVGAAGVVEGTARVLRTPEDAAALGEGEILVTTVTNIGWTLIFPRAAAVVTDVGAPLSHAAIVARELGIPAVVGCGNATMRVHSGDRLRVDGGRGTVEVLRQP